ncbi:putative beta-glucan synthesis-associated protein SKN1 [Umbelopsis sp. PMI_123]|nr:putative beta-glucan synthesis-associated protein SKN1 [Umbelopsis sp. PMI_123]
MPSPPPSSFSDYRPSLSDSESPSNQSNHTYDQPNQSQQRLLGTPHSASSRSNSPINATTFTDEDPYTIDLKKDLADKDFDTSVRPHITLSLTGLLNTAAVILLLLAIVGVFAGLPISLAVSKNNRERQAAAEKNNNWNSTVPPTTTVPLVPGGVPVIDSDTPASARTKTSLNGETWKLVFSDEFNKPGRTFYPGEDPFWEAVDLHYWVTGDMEWYTPDAVTTAGGNLVITLSERNLHNLNYASGMLQSWNKLCFTGGLIEVNVSLPGPPDVGGFWPGAWTLGNLARPGYGATTDGTWPYAYDTCDAGVTKNQSMPNAFSYLPGQRLNSCVKSGDHPSIGKGRGAPEIDILEVASADSNFGGKVGSVSQSGQFAPFDWAYTPNSQYIYLNNSTIGNNGKTIVNGYKGGNTQQAVSALTALDPTMYDGKKFQTFAFEYVPSNTPGEQSYIRWLINGQETWRMLEPAVGPNPKSQVSQRLISNEPMSVVFNLGMSNNWGTVNLNELPIPANYYIDYIRIYQHPNRVNLNCDPQDYPTSEYIKLHYNAYTNPNLTTWSQAGYTFPSFSV